MPSRAQWEQSIQHFEADWWGDCCNTYGEETKQIAYSRVMGIYPGEWRGGDHWPVYDWSGLRVLDVGGGPSSMLLKAKFAQGVVVDPCPYPDWVAARYEAHGIDYRRVPAEDELPIWEDGAFDVALIYNVLQHVMQPDKILVQMARVARKVHLFEWVEMPPHPGHPHTLEADRMAALLPPGEAQHVWLDEQYRETDPIGALVYPVEDGRKEVKQHAWGGTFFGV